jgi:predicted metal-dependent peptidase
MGQAELVAGMSEIQGILKKTGAEILFATFDANSYGVHKVKSVREAMVRVKGGGGTDTRPAFAELEKLPYSKRPSIIVVVTDTMIGGCHPEKPPAWARTIWCGVGSSATRPCPWGDYVSCND